MAGKIDFVLSKKSVNSYGSDSVLQTSLKSGLSLNYRCSNGNCGECKAILRKGQVKLLRSHDYLLSDAQKGQGYFLMCSNAPDGDIVVEATEVSDARHIPEQTILGKVKVVEQVDHQVMHLHLRNPRSQRLQFIAGQGARLGGNNGLPAAVFPMASCPCDEVSMLFHIPNIPGNAFSQAVFSGKISKGTKLQITGPVGHFRFDEHREKSAIFIAWHTGFAPIKSIIENILDLRSAEEIRLYRVSPLEKDKPQAQRHYMDNYCRSWQDAYHHFQYTPMNERFKLVSSVDDAQKIGQNIVSDIADLTAYDFYIVGPPAFTQGIRAVLDQKTLPSSDVKSSDIVMGL